MTEPTQTPSTSPEADAVSSLPENPAVALCSEAYERTMQETREQGKGSVYCAFEAQKAFRMAMPPLSGLQNIRDFIACVARGLLIEAIDGAAAARLLYAAQVAHTTIRDPRAAPKSVSTAAA